jgi:REP element-mobilizing transposase RayT
MREEKGAFLMASPRRIEFAGAFYHVGSRGNRKQPIFQSDEDRHFFLNCLRQAHERFGALFHAFCLMDNHYHLFLETPRGGLSRIMHLINLKYACYFNAKYAHCGHTFQSRFEGVLVQAEEYARELSCYIHLNPVRAGMVGRPEEYRWSNYGEYIGLASPEPWTANAFVLRLFGSTLDVARKNYEAYVMQRISQTMTNPLGVAKKSGILGSPAFVSALARTVCPVRELRPGGAAVELPRPIFRPNLGQVLAESESLLGPKNRLARKIAIYICHKGTDHPLRSIGEFFGIGDSGIADTCRRLKRELAQNVTLARVVSEIENRLRSELD